MAADDASYERLLDRPGPSNECDSDSAATGEFPSGVSRSVLRFVYMRLTSLANINKDGTGRTGRSRSGLRQLWGPVFACQPNCHCLPRVQ